MVLVVFIRICGIIFELLNEVSIVQGCLLKAGFYDNYLYSTFQMTASTCSLKLIILIIIQS